MSTQTQVAAQINAADDAIAYREQLAALNVAPLWDGTRAWTDLRHEDLPFQR
jgi:hypothetical protein